MTSLHVLPAGAAEADNRSSSALTGLTRSGAPRVDAVDMLRGLVIALMVLDHVRDFFHYHADRFDPTDPASTTGLIYLTRWVTHLCAPTFVFLAGVSIYFQRANGKGAGQLSSFLVKRGLWLILLEVTIVTFGFNFSEPMIFLQVIWAIGICMICMALLARLPAPAILALGAALLLLYPLLLPLTAGAAGAAGLLRTLALTPTVIPGDVPVLAVYPVIPWLAVMCLGYGLGPVFRAPPGERARRLLALAAAFLSAFFLLRFLNGFGDPMAWREFPTGGQTAMSFFNVSKYPPSANYVLVTLGISFLLFLGLERVQGPARKLLLAFGRTPLFTYLLHIYIAHSLMLAAALATGFPASVATDFLLGNKPLEMGWGTSLLGVYLVWLLVLGLLYPLARWFEGVKRRRRDPWLSYL
jgi:uncharacterized membrane protein